MPTRWAMKRTLALSGFPRQMFLDPGPNGETLTTLPRSPQPPYMTVKGDLPKVTPRLQLPRACDSASCDPSRVYEPPHLERP